MSKVVDQDSAAVVQGFMMALGGGDFGAARSFLADGASWLVVGKDIPGGGLHEGGDNVMAFIKRVRSLFVPGHPSMDIRHFAAVDGLVVVEAHGSGKLVDGREYSNPYLITTDVVDGKITQIREYFDSHYVGSLNLDL